MNNRQIAEVFSGMADILDIQGAGYHRVTAYRRAAEIVATLARPLEEIRREEKLTSIPGIGTTLASKIDELIETGDLEAYRELKSQVPEGVVAMLQVSGIGPRSAARFWKELGIASVADLERAAQARRLRELHGFGPTSERNVLHGIELYNRRTGRTRFGDAWPLAQEMLAALRAAPGVVRAAPAGSLRRMRETVGDLDLLVASADAQRVMDSFTTMPQVDDVILSGATKTSIRTQEGFQVDLRVIAPDRWGTALQYFTGSQAHNIKLRGLALDRGLSLSEYALEDRDGATGPREILCASEEEVYGALGLPFIPPELREDRGEIEAARQDALPDLIEIADLKGDLQFHTTSSDGQHRLLEMAQAARTAGLTYALVTDHTHGLGVASGLTVERLQEQRSEIAAVNEQLDGTFRVLAGIEVEVRGDGSLDLPDDVLSQLDLVVAAVHSGLRQDRERVTARMLAAIRHPHVDIIAHPTGRLIGEREGADLDMEAIFREAAETGTALEVNAHPSRLDLNDVHIRRAIELGVRLVVSSDAHSRDGFNVLPLGVATARRGWATAADVLNTRSDKEVLRCAKRA